MKGLDRYRVEGVRCRCGGRLLPVVNLSVSGFFVETDAPPPPGESEDLELALPRGSIRLRGRIAWVNDKTAPSVRGLPPGFGVKILSISFPDRMALLAVLRQAHPAALRRG